MCIRDRLYTEATKGIISNSTQQIQKSLSPAITTLKAIVEDKDANIHARVSAARSLLEDVYKRQWVHITM